MSITIREQMKDKVNNNYTCTGKFIKYGYVKGGLKMLLTNIVTFHGESLADHVWITATNGFKCGDIINFVGKIKPYIKQSDGDYVVDFGFKKVKHVYKSKETK